MQTRKRWLGSKIDREIGTELLDAEIKYSQIRFSRDVSKKLVSWLAKHSKNGSDPLSNQQISDAKKKKNIDWKLQRLISGF